MASSFAASISDWVKETKQRQDAVFKESAQRVIEQMQTPVGAGGAMPVDTGFLRASLQVSTEGPQPINPAARPVEGRTYSIGPVALTIAGAELGATLYATYGAAYAAHVNYGTSSMQGRQFVGLVAQQWPGIVTQVCVELQSRSGGAASGNTPAT